MIRAFFTSKVIAIAVLMVVSFTWEALAGNFMQEVDMTWGSGRGKILNNGQLLTLSLDRTSGSGFRSKRQYMYGKIDLQIKLVPGNSAGTVTTFYLSSLGGNHDEIDFEFLGNLSGDPYVLHTNVYAQGKGSKEQQFYLWFDPTKDFHTYSVLWNPLNTIFYVDGTPIRQFKNLESKGISYPKNQPMWVYASLWDAEDWATRGGLVKTDWSKAPFLASFRNFNVQTCSSSSYCPWMHQALGAIGETKIKWFQSKYMIYNYCTDFKRFPQGFPPECHMS